MHFRKCITSSSRGLTFWHVTALLSFMAIAIGLTTTIMSSGFNSGETTKEVLIQALDEVHHNLQIVGKIAGNADLSNDKILTTATPITIAANGTVDVSQNNIKINFKLIKVDYFTVIYDDIHVGTLHNKTYNTINDAMIDAKKFNLIEVNPYVDEEKVENTSAFIYWVANSNYDEWMDTGELGVLAIVYAEKDRPSTGEYIRVEAIAPEGNILEMERTIANISANIVDLGGKIQSAKP